MGNRGEETRRAMLTAGVDRVDGAALTDLLAFLRPAEVAAAAGRSKSTFFHHWPSLESYIEDLVEFVAVAVMDQPGIGMTLGMLDRIPADTAADMRSTGVVAWVRSVCLTAFDELSADPRLPLQFLGPVSGDDARHEVLQERYRELDDLAGRVIEELLSRYGLRIREPFTGASVARTMNALLLGLVLRARVDPDGSTAMLFADVATALLPTLIEPASESGMPLDQFVDRAMLRQVNDQG